MFWIIIEHASYHINSITHRETIISGPTPPHARSLSSCTIGKRTREKVSGSRVQSFVVLFSAVLFSDSNMKLLSELFSRFFREKRKWRSLHRCELSYLDWREGSVGDDDQRRMRGQEIISQWEIDFSNCFLEAQWSCSKMWENRHYARGVRLRWRVSFFPQRIID